MDKKIKKSVLQILLSAGLLTELQVNEIQSKEKILYSKILKSREKNISRNMVLQPDVSIIDIIDSMKLEMSDNNSSCITEEIIMKEVANHMGIPFLKIDPLKLDSEVVTKVISRPYATKYQIVPIKLTDNTLTLATSNPFDHEGVDGIKQSKGYTIDLVISTKSDIMRIITEFFGFKSSIAAAHDKLESQIDLGNLEQYVKLQSISEIGATNQHIINAVEYLLHYAYSQRASDIHIEPKREHSLVRLRIDGMLHNIHKMPKAVHPAIVSRIKTLSRMDIAEKRRPQDGRIKTDHEGKEIELRISTLPISFGEKIVIRIFDPAFLMQNLDKLGFLERELEMFKSFIAVPHGILLVTGPTGSGKTTCLYSTLKTLSNPEVNITTIEDPVEMICEDFNQIAVKPQIGITFASSLRTILRQDPDIIMVGEIRDFETADNAIQAALTGHLVMSTLHTNDAPSSATRLIDLGVQPFLINSTLIGVIAQRLVRKVCAYCAETYHLSEDECKVLGIEYSKVKNLSVSIGTGCPQCRGTGYYGRTGIFEILEVTDKIKAAIERKDTPSQIKKIARSEGFSTLRENAIKILLQGTTTFDEIVRVTGLLT
jgi:general secretion pathway protein E